ncbi:hypothetical protein V8G57_15475 [Collimonas sp. H4R21]|uniref:Uncharacterized protein n=1 Tax=Collimonas rhizosphaerae TaxID=3126357 RepID=A0ABU9PXR4_9BURK
MVSKIRVKVGSTEIEFEGSEDYMREELPKLIELLGDISSVNVNDENDEVADVLPSVADPAGKTLQMTTNTIASKLGVGSGAELVLAACAHLCLVKGADKYSRSNILGEMKLASNFYKTTYNNNLSASLKTLVKGGKLLETAADVYALDAKEKTRIEAKLSGA